MSVRIRGFEWDEANVRHLRKAHPHLTVELLQEIVESAKEYTAWGRDRYGKKIYGARGGRLIVLFNLKDDNTARIFSVREVRK